METVVLKFGGIALSKKMGGYPYTLNAVNRHLEDGKTPLLVLSARAGVTRKLTFLADEAIATSRGHVMLEQIDKIIEEHVCLAEDLAGSLTGKDRSASFRELNLCLAEVHKSANILRADLNPLFEWISRSKRDGKFGSRQKATAKAFIETVGERLSLIIAQAYFRANGLQVVCLSAPELVTANTYGAHTSIDMEDTTVAIRAKTGEYFSAGLDRSRALFLMAGFIASTPVKDTRSLVTLGYDGSDISAVAAGASLNCTVELYKKIDGHLSDVSYGGILASMEGRAGKLVSPEALRLAKKYRVPLDLVDPRGVRYQIMRETLVPAVA